MKSVARAWAPANISCIFGIVDNRDPQKAGSVGLGFTINKGVTATVSAADRTTIVFNNQAIDFPTVTAVLKKLTKRPLQISLESELPLGSGFGLSGASAIATAYAANKLLDLQKPSLDLARLAHIAEVECGTGLGDVVNQYFGGCILKLQSSAHFVVKQTSLKHTPVYCASYGPIQTKSVIRDPHKKLLINSAAERAMAKINQLENSNSLSFKDMVGISNDFARQSGLLTDMRVAKIIQSITKQGAAASMIMLGRGVYSTIAFEGAIKYMITNKKAHIL